MDNLDLGQSIKHMRVAAGYSQKELAEKLKMSHTTISSYETKSIQPPLDVFQKIAKLCEFEIIITVKDKNSKQVHTIKKRRA